MSSKPDFTTSASENHVKNIPAELRTLNQWVCWHYETRNGKPTKPPISPRSNGKLLYAKTDDPTTWSDFDTANASVTRLGLQGVGLSLSATDGLTGLDLDHVIDPETGELNPLAHEVLTRFAGSYAEISPSGNGLRIWCYGKPGRSGKCAGKVKWLEVYSHPSNRYLTVTGNHWSGSATAVTEQQDALNWLHGRFMQASTERRPGSTSKPLPPSVDAALDLDDAALLTKARKASDGAAFDALWSGDTSAYGGDHSAADLALLNKLAFWTANDAGRMDRLFRQSGLMRPKWDSRRGETTYGEMSVSKAVESCREVFDSRKLGTASEAPKPARDEVSDGNVIIRGSFVTGWQAELMRRANSDQLLKNHFNAVMIVQNAYPGLVGYNEFRQRIEARIPSPWRKDSGPWTDRDTGELAFHLAKSFTSFGIDMLCEAIATVANRHPYNPAQERLRALAGQWDGKGRLLTWLVDYLGAAHNARNERYLQEIGSAWLKGVAARVLKPGCKRDDVLVLRGLQGYLKSTAAKLIADCIHPDAFTDSLGNLDSKDARSSIRGIIIAELGELAALNKSDVESIKSFVAACVDHFRPAYGRMDQDFPRTVSFIGTTNDPTFLKDPTGNRRWWPVTIPEPINIPRFNEALPQLLGEAARRVLEGEKWFVDDPVAMAQANEVRAAHFVDDVWTEAVLRAADLLLSPGCTLDGANTQFVTIPAILGAMGVRIEQQTVPNQTRIGGILRVAGWRDKKRRIGERKDNRTVWAWYPPLVPPISPVPPVVPPIDARQTAAVTPVTPGSPYFEHLVKMEEKNSGSDSGSSDSGSDFTPPILPFVENRWNRGNQGEPLDKQGTRQGEPVGGTRQEGEPLPPVDTLNPAVKEATAQYQTEMDVLAAWFADCCVVKKHCETKAADLYAAYTRWCEQSGEYPEKQRRFGMRLTERGFQRFRSTGGDHFWRGIGLRLSSTEDTQDTQKRQFSASNDFDVSYSKNCREWVTSVTSVTTEKPDDNPPVDTLDTAAPDIARDSAGAVTHCKNCGGKP
jgi:predicted P-loop ATPase